MPCRSTSAISLLFFAAPSNIEYSVWTCRWTNESLPEPEPDGTGRLQADNRNRGPRGARVGSGHSTATGEGTGSATTPCGLVRLWNSSVQGRSGGRNEEQSKAGLRQFPRAWKTALPVRRVYAGPARRGRNRPTESLDRVCHTGFRSTT